ncbi:MAG: UDP-galactopyranose mutase [Coriobacteriales bacterium]|jgi:UDP-galactopyranose mutase|nr:UDP-galactopyranose mutase [Coriobacteriales bacterium]
MPQNYHDVSGLNPEKLNLPSYDVLVVGAGFAGSVVARELAERAGKRVALIEQRPHVGGNAYDHYDAAGVLVHDYGPHIYHSNSTRVHDYLSRFTRWYAYDHKVLADIHGIYTPVPFNLSSIELHFEHSKAEKIKAALLEAFGRGSKVPIIDLRNQADPLLAELADFVYHNVFLHYTQKQWGQTPEQIDPAVTGRVPVLVDRDDRYFQDRYQGMPLAGYTALFDTLLEHPNITVFTGLDANEILSFSPGGAAGAATQSALEDTGFSAALVCEKPYEGTLIYTGQLDRLVGNRLGLLPYRSLDFVYKTFERKHVLPCGTVNYTVSEKYTRITEFSYLTGQDLDVTTIMEEYPRAFEGLAGQIPYYAIASSANEAHYQRYLQLFAGLENFHVLGRLAEYRYYNMDQIVLRALELADELCR